MSFVISLEKIGLAMIQHTRTTGQSWFVLPGTGSITVYVDRYTLARCTLTISPFTGDSIWQMPLGCELLDDAGTWH